MSETSGAKSRNAAARRPAPRERLQALQRGLRALAYMNRKGVATNSEVARAIGLKYSTAHRVLMVLGDLGLVRHDSLGHQFVLGSCVRELSAGFRDSTLIDDFALPRMRAWTQLHGLPVLFVTASGGEHVVRASTDTHWPVSGERCLPGSKLTGRATSEAQIFAAFGVPAASSALARKVRRRGYAQSLLASHGEIHISVPILAETGLVACMSIRCSRSFAARNPAMQRSIAGLCQLAAEIAVAYR